MNSAVPRAEHVSTRPSSPSPSARPPSSGAEMAQRGTASKNAKQAKPWSDRTAMRSGIGHAQITAPSPAGLALPSGALRAPSSAGSQHRHATMASSAKPVPIRFGTIAGKRLDSPYVQPPTAGPTSCTQVPEAKTMPTMSVCRSGPASSMERRPKRATKPFPPPRSKKRTITAVVRSVQNPKRQVPSAIKTMDAVRAVLRPNFAAKQPQRLEVGTRPRVLADARKPATKPAWSRSSAHPRSALIIPA
mmetsp:Transcript_122451/g.357512  ORF Transcript_122451/g.357512 Transcript_122451/m.357512 type:complete len:247 (-) Transcript_122451:193-933(-)